MEDAPFLVGLVAGEQGGQVVHIARRAEVVVHAADEEQDVGRLPLLVPCLRQVHPRNVLGQHQRPPREVHV